jgi:hypothetical protein
MEKELVGIQPLIDICALTLQSAYIKPYKPISLLIISKPESAKTSAILKFSKEKEIFFTNEVTAKLLLDNILPLAERKEIKHILIPDLLNCIEKQKSTRQQFLNTIKSLIEEGLSSVLTYHKKFVATKEAVKCGLITAITTTDFQKTRKYLESIGLLSRFIPFTYDYPTSKLKYIFDVIQEKEISKEKGVTIPKINKTLKSIKGKYELFKQLEIVSIKLGQEYSAYGIRAQENLQRLAKANALLNKREEIKQEDITKIIELSNWINFKFNPI